MAWIPFMICTQQNRDYRISQSPDKCTTKVLRLRLQALSIVSLCQVMHGWYSFHCLLGPAEACMADRRFISPQPLVST